MLVSDIYENATQKAIKIDHGTGCFVPIDVSHPAWSWSDRRQMLAYAVRAFRCPRCNAGPWMPCVGVSEWRGEMQIAHIERANLVINDAECVAHG